MVWQEFGADFLLEFGHTFLKITLVCSVDSYLLCLE